MEKVENVGFWQFLRYCEKGEKAGSLLVSLVKNSQGRRDILPFQLVNGELVTQDKVVLEEFVRFYKNLYKSLSQIEVDRMDLFLGYITLPKISDTDRVSLEEIEQVVRGLGKCKAVGSDGLPCEIYQCYRQILFPQLLEVFNESYSTGC